MLFWADLVFGVRIITDRDSGQSNGFAGANAEIDAAIYDVNTTAGEKDSKPSSRNQCSFHNLEYIEMYHASLTVSFVGGHIL